MKIYREKANGTWIESDWVITPSFEIKAKDYSSDEDLQGFQIRATPPTAFMEWLEETNPEEFDNRGYSLPKPFSITYKNEKGKEETFEGSAEEVLEKLSGLTDFEITDNKKGSTLTTVGSIGKNPGIGGAGKSP